MAPAAAPSVAAPAPGVAPVVPQSGNATGRAAVRPALTVQVVEDSWGFTALRPRWNELLRASATDNPFLTWEWLHAWWTCLRAGQQLHLIVVRAGDELVGIAPLCVVRSRMPGLSRLEFLGTGYAGSDYLDLIVRRGEEERCLEAIAQTVESGGLAVRFTHVPPTSMAARLAEMLAGRRWMARTADDGTCPIVPLEGQTFDSYLATLGSSHRANFRRRLRGLEQRFDVRFERVASDGERQEMLAALAAFSERRWQREGGSSAFMTAAVKAFQDDATKRALERGWLRLYVLRLDGETAAVMYGFQYGGRFYFYQHGFDDRFRDLSVGLVLMGLSIRAALEEGAREFDMLWGVESYKFLWARDAARLRRIDLFPPHLGGLVHRGVDAGRRRLRRLARQVLRFGEFRGS